YFLASSLCITPISALSGPVMQFFQPGLTKAIFNDSPNVIKTLRVYISTLCVSTLLPSYILWVYRDSLIALWLGNTELVNIVADYTRILLPGIAIGGLGYISYVVLIAIEDFKFQSFLSLSMTAIVVILVVFFSMRQDIRSICYVYAFYHSLSTLLTWARCYYLPRTQKYALETAKMLFIIMIALAVLCVFFNLIINRI
ncbi:TPA: O109 family O-antigen flippase, partial [Escherichia coli]|nr:O109 family O-antigen flippase [Escherichia coli]